MRIRLPSRDEVHKVPLHYIRKSNVQARYRLARIVKGIRKIHCVDSRGYTEFIPEAGIAAFECLPEKILVELTRDSPIVDATRPVWSTYPYSPLKLAGYKLSVSTHRAAGEMPGNRLDTRLA